MKKDLRYIIYNMFNNSSLKNAERNSKIKMQSISCEL